MINTADANAYLGKVKKALGDPWMKDAEQAKITYETVGGIARRYALDCYINGISVKECVKTIKTKYPEGK